MNCEEMNFKKFNEETSKIRVYYGPMLNYGGLTATNGPSQSTTESLERVQGLHFPNSKELLILWDMLAPYKVRQDRRDRKIIYMDAKEFLPPYFVTNLKKMINAEGIGLDYAFDDTNSHLAYAIHKAESEGRPAGTITSEDLTTAVGLAFEKLGRLNNDIRIAALNKNPAGNVIQNLTPARVGYIGEIVVIKGNLPKESEYTSF